MDASSNSFHPTSENPHHLFTPTCAFGHYCMSKGFIVCFIVQLCDLIPTLHLIIGHYKKSKKV